MIVSKTDTEIVNERKQCPFESCVYYQTLEKFMFTFIMLVIMF